MTRELSTDQKGAIAESAVTHTAVRLGIDVYRPVFEGGRYDLIFDLGDRLVRVQCKWARCAVMSLPSGWPRAAGPRKVSGTARTEGEIDAVAAYCADLQQCFYIPARMVIDRREVSLRLRPCRNHQMRRVNWAADYELERLELGALGP